MEKLAINIRLKSFNSIEEMVKDNYFVDRVKYYLDEILRQRFLREDAPAGYRYKKDGLDLLIQDELATSKYFINNYPNIYNKISSITSARRNVIEFVCGKAVNDTLNNYKINVTVGDKFNVKESRAKLKVIDIKQEDNTITIEMLKKRETWPISKFVESVIDGTLTLIKI